MPAIDALFDALLAHKGSDLHLTVGRPPMFRVRGELVPAHRSLSEAALPVMEDLREATRQRIHLAVLEGVDVVYVEILGSSGVDVTSRTGGRLPAHATGVGKAILAYSSAATVRARIEAGLPRLTPRTIATTARYPPSSWRPSASRGR